MQMQICRCKYADKKKNLWVLAVILILSRREAGKAALAFGTAPLQEGLFLLWVGQ